MSEQFSIERDQRGRITHKTGAAPGAGRPREADAEHIRAIVREVLDEDTVVKWQAAMRRKLAKGNAAASAFVRDTLAGKPAVNADVTVNGDLVAFMAAWNAVSEASEGEEDHDR